MPAPAMLVPAARASRRGGGLLRRASNGPSPAGEPRPGRRRTWAAAGRRRHLLLACLAAVLLGGGPARLAAATAAAAPTPPAVDTRAAVLNPLGGVDLDTPVTLQVEAVMVSEAFARLEHESLGLPARRWILLLPADPGCYNDQVTLELAPQPLHVALDRICAAGHLRWTAGAGVVLVDHPLAPAALQALVEAAHPHALPLTAAQLTAGAQAANALVRCGDRDGVLALLAALGDPALDQVAPGERPRAQTYQQGLLDALGARTPATSCLHAWSASPALLVLAPLARASIARAWARAGRGELSYTPLLCYLAGAAQVEEALPVLRRLAMDPAAVVTDLDPHGLRQAVALGLIRASAIWSLGVLRDHASVPALTEVLQASPPPPVLEMTLLALGMLGDAAAADALAAVSTTHRHVQGECYLSLARCRPAALLPLAKAWGGGVMPPGWWEGVSLAPVSQVLPLAFAARDLQGVDNPWEVLDAWRALARLPGATPRVVAAAQDQLARTTDPHLRTLDQMLLAQLGDGTLHARLFAAALAAPVLSPDAWQPWERPLDAIGPLTPPEQEQLLAVPAAVLSHWDAFTPLAARRQAVDAKLLQASTATAGPPPVDLIRAMIELGEPVTCARLLHDLTPPPTGDGAACLSAITQLPRWGVEHPALIAALVALLQDPRPAVAGRAAVYLANNWKDDRSQVPLVAWEARQRLEDLPAALVNAPNAPWSVPGPRRYPLRLPYAAYGEQADLVTHWALTSTNAAIQRTLIWWLGIHTQETQRDYRVRVVQALEQLANATDAGVAEGARTMLRRFVAFGLDQGEASIQLGLTGDDDDREALVALDALVAPVRRLLAAPVQPHPAHGSF